MTASGSTRLMIVGSPRSGTTLLQTILATQIRLFTVKETHFFRHLQRRRPLRLLDRLALDPARVQHALAYVAEHNGLAMPADPLPRTLATATAAFDRLLSQEALRLGMTGWLEKTPEHAFFTATIRRHLPGVRFVHILRDGPDVVASLWDARQRYPDSWGWLGDLDDMVSLYNRYAHAAQRARGHADSFVLLYNDLVERKAATLEALAAFLDLPAGSLSLDRVSSYRADIVRADEPWKIRSDDRVVDTRGGKFGSLFSADEQARIRRGLVPMQGMVSG
jgi:Sulfotransferase family